MLTVAIGRSLRADVVLEHETISRLHAEITVTSRGHWFLVDRNSSHGTYVWRKEEWIELRQGYVALGEYLAFGKYKVKLSELICMLGNTGDIQMEKQCSEGVDPISVKPKRNAITGEIT